MDWCCCSVWRKEINWDVFVLCVCVWDAYTCGIVHLQNLCLNESMLAGTHAHNRTCPAACHWTGGVEQTALMLWVFFSSPLPLAQHGDPNQREYAQNKTSWVGKKNLTVVYGNDAILSTVLFNWQWEGVLWKGGTKWLPVWLHLFSCVSLRQLCFHKQHHMCHLFPNYLWGFWGQNTCKLHTFSLIKSKSHESLKVG